MTILALTSPLLSAHAHGFFGRTGGVSTGMYSSLNVGLGTQDDPGAVQENRARVLAHLQSSAVLLTAYQTHSARCAMIDAAWPSTQRPQADAMVTTRSDVVLGVLTADCGPVLLADPHAHVIAVAHAGWAGTLGGIISATVQTMQALGAQPSRVVAVLGPCIAQPSYEVGEDLRARFIAADTRFARYFAPGVAAGKYQFDLSAAVLDQLARAGVQEMHSVGEDTYSQETRFFSFRRTTHAGEADYGRQISVIGHAAS